MLGGGVVAHHADKLQGQLLSWLVEVPVEVAASCCDGASVLRDNTVFVNKFVLEQ